MKPYKNYKDVINYADCILKGNKLAGKEIIKACERFKKDIKNENYEFIPRDAEFIIQIIENTIVHDQGEKLTGEALRKKPFILETWQKFIIYNLLGFYYKGTKIRKYKEAFIFIPRKNGKTRFISALAWALALLERKSGSKIYI